MKADNQRGMVRSFILGAALTMALACAAVLMGCGDGWGPPCPETTTIYIKDAVIWGLNNKLVLLTNDVVVKREGLLIILPGTAVMFRDNTVVICDPAGNLERSPNLYVEGGLVCAGKPDKPVRFVGSDASDMGGSIIVYHGDAMGKKVSLNWVEGIDRMNIMGGEPSLVHCDIEELSLSRTSNALVDSCQLGALMAGRDASGIVSHNIFSNYAHLNGDSLRIENNVFRGLGGPWYGAISCRGGSRALITNNTIENCAVGIQVFGATPSAHQNNFLNNDVTLAISALSGEVQADTLHFENNWWGTTEWWDIRFQIKYLPNRGVLSEKFVQYRPFAQGPFDLGK